MPADYASVAASKRAGEDALRAMQPMFDKHGVTFEVVSADMIDGTIIVGLLARRDPDAVAARRVHAVLPTVEEFAGAVARAARDPVASGDTVNFRGADYLAAAAC